MGLYARRTIDPANSEALVWKRPLALKHDGSVTPVVFCMGHGGSELSSLDDAGGYYKPTTAMALAGYPVVAAALGGGTTWGNDTSITRAGQALDFARTAEVGARLSGKFFIAGFSMGALTAMNAARLIPTQIAGIMLFLPDTDLAFSHDTLDSGAWASEINTAYGGSGAYTAALPTHNPAQYGPTDLKGIPILFVYATDEAQGVSTLQANFATAMSAVSPVEVHTQTGGHSLDNLDTTVIAPWMNWVMTTGAADGARKPVRRTPFKGPYALGLRPRIQPVQTTYGVGTISGSGSMTAAGTRTVFGSAASLSGAGSMTATGTRKVFGTSATITGAGSMTGAGTRKVFGTSATLSGAGSFSASGVRKVFGTSGSIAGAGSFTASGVRKVFGTGSLTGAGSMTGAGTRKVFGTNATISSTGSFTAAGTRKVFGTGTLTGTASLTGAGVRTIYGTGSLSGTATPIATGVVSATGQPLRIRVHNRKELAIVETGHKELTIRVSNRKQITIDL